MRYLIAAVLIGFMAPHVSEAQNTKAACSTRCQTNYNFCVSRAITKKARNLCKAERKSCHRGCNALKQ